jgi:putative endonuclease
MDSRICGNEKKRFVKKKPYVYILASKRNGTLYVGVTSDLVQRIWQHKNDLVEGFTRKYGVHMLVYAEPHDDILSAIRREKAMKKWKRAWKITLIQEHNPTWRDLFRDISADSTQWLRNVLRSET